MRVLFVLGILLSLYSVYLFLSYDLSSVPPIETSIGEVRADTGGSFTGGGGIGVGRLDIPGVGASPYGSFVALTGLMGFFFFRRTDGIAKKAYLVGTLFLLSCSILSFSRGALISVVAGLVYLTWKRFFTAREIGMLLVVGMVIVGIAGYVKVPFGDEDIIARWRSIGSYDEGIEDRVEFMYNSLLFWVECPVIGCGFKGVFASHGEYNVAGDHNYYTQVLATRGIVGFIPLVFFVGMLFRKVSGRMTIAEDYVKSLMQIMSAGMVMVMINLLSLGPAEFFHVWIWFGLVAASINVASGMKVGGGDETAPILASNVSRDIRVGGERRYR